jgi:hypothetical protein
MPDFGAKIGDRLKANFGEKSEDKLAKPDYVFWRQK